MIFKYDISITGGCESCGRLITKSSEYPNYKDPVFICDLCHVKNHFSKLKIKNRNKRIDSILENSIINKVKSIFR